MKITTASIAIIAVLASHADHVLARNGRTLKSSKAGGRGKGELTHLHRIRFLATNFLLTNKPSLFFFRQYLLLWIRQGQQGRIAH